VRLKTWHLFIAFNVIIAFTSCQKSAKCDCSLDTLKVAKFIQPEAILGKDAVIESISPDQNFGGESFFTVFSWTNALVLNSARALILFDLSSIPRQTQIKSAKLNLYWNTYGNLTEQTGENAFTIYRINQAWDEYSVTWNNQPTVTNIDSITVAKTTSSNQSYSIDVTRMTQDMISKPWENYGFMLRLDQEFPYRLVILASSDYSDISKHPKLTILY